jgi:hypothetical protein
MDYFPMNMKSKENSVALNHSQRDISSASNLKKKREESPSQWLAAHATTPWFQKQKNIRNHSS